MRRLLVVLGSCADTASLVFLITRKEAVILEVTFDLTRNDYWQLNKYAYVFTDRMASISIPRRAFSSDAEMQEFFQKALSFSKTATNTLSQLT